MTIDASPIRYYMSKRNKKDAAGADGHLAQAPYEATDHKSDVIKSRHHVRSVATPQPGIEVKQR